MATKRPVGLITRRPNCAHSGHDWHYSLDQRWRTCSRCRLAEWRARYVNTWYRRGQVSVSGEVAPREPVQHGARRV